jgi:hypothetical protein
MLKMGEKNESNEEVCVRRVLFNFSVNLKLFFKKSSLIKIYFKKHFK